MHDNQHMMYSRANHAGLLLLSGKKSAIFTVLCFPGNVAFLLFPDIHHISATARAAQPPAFAA
jgi:hypothetical protein